MGLFSRAPRSRFPADMLWWLEIFGRHSLDPQHSGGDGSDIWRRLAPLHEYSSSDREGLLAELTAIVAQDQGGFATFGAARVVWEMFGADALRIPAALPLIDGGIAFKRSRGLARLPLTALESQRVAQLGEQGG